MACGSESDRDRVGDYIESINAAQEQARPLLRRADDVYKRFANDRLTGPQAEVELRRNRLLIDAVRAEIAARPAPAPALRLRRLVLAVYDANHGMAEQTRLMAAYLPAQRSVLRRFRTLGTRLQRRLRAARSDVGKQARALRSYSDGLVVAARRMGRLHPPLVLAASRDSALQRLHESREVALGLRRAVLDGDQADVLRLLDRFQEVNLRVPGRDASRAAYRAYTEYASAIQATEARVAAEVRRLNGSLRD